MNRKKLARLRREIVKLMGSSRKPRELERLAAKLGRKRVKHGAYTWESEVFNLSPLSIPHHSKELSRFTAEGILEQLEAQDVLAWEQRIEQEERRKEEHRHAQDAGGVSEGPIRKDAVSE